MNAVEIEEAISKLAEASFDPASFPHAFLEAFGKDDHPRARQKTNHPQKNAGPIPALKGPFRQPRA